MSSVHPGLSRAAGVNTYRGFEEALNTGKPIWVLNNSQPKSMLIITITDPLSGKPKTLDFPRTFIPLCLTDMLPRSVLEQSLELRTFIRKGILKMISEDDAFAILGSEDGLREHNRLMPSEFAQGNNVSGRVQDMIDSGNLARNTASITAVDPAAGLSVEALANLHPKLKAWESRSLVGELSAQDLMSELRIHSTELTESDCLYLINGQFPAEVRTYATTKLKAKDVAKAHISTTGAAAKGNVGYEDDRGYDADYDIVK